MEKLIIIFGALILIGIIFSYIYLSKSEEKPKSIEDNKQKEENKIINEDKDILNLRTEDEFYEEKVLNFIRNKYQQKFNISTQNLSFKEIINLENNKNKKEILEKIFQILEKRIYGGSEINRENLKEILEKFNF